MSGYIGTTPTPQATQTRDVFTATAGQTSFATSGYSVGFLDVYVNGSHLKNGTDYTASNGSDVVMASGLAAGDYVEVVAFTTFSTSDTVSASGGGTFSGDVSFGDSVKAKFGAGSDLQIYHNGSASFIDDAGNGYLNIQGNGVSINKYTGETMALFVADGAATLYHDNSSKLATSSYGVTVTGSDYQLRLNQGSNQPYYIRHASDNSLRMHLNGTGDRVTVDSNGKLGIGTTSPSSTLDISAPTNTTPLTIKAATDGYNYTTIKNAAGNDVGYIGIGSSLVPSGSSDDFVLRAQRDDLVLMSGGNSERLRIDSSGNLMVSKTSVGAATAGFETRSSGYTAITRDGGQPLEVRRLTSNGQLIDLRKDSTSVGAITVLDGERISIHSGTVGVEFNPSNQVNPSSGSGGVDNTLDLGASSARWDDIYATNGTIQTSDRNEKQQIAPLTSAEITAAKAISQLFKTYKWNSSVESKGGAARTHAGVIAQEVEAAMSDAGLDAGNYAFFISTTWWETSTEVAAVEADEENGIKAQEAYISIETYSTADEAPEGAVERNRKGIRYPELLSFIGAATEQRLTSIEARLDTLEAG